MNKISYDEWRDIASDLRHEYAEMLGYQFDYEIPTAQAIDLEHRLSEIWINYKMS